MVLPILTTLLAKTFKQWDEEAKRDKVAFLKWLKDMNNKGRYNPPMTKEQKEAVEQEQLDKVNMDIHEKGKR